MMQQDKISENGYFFTLTYDTDHVPITENGFLTLTKDHLQLFFKRLRFAQHGSEKSDIKYFAVGEYGTEKRRPHYHAIIFNLQLEHIFDKVDRLALEYSDYDGKVHVKTRHWPYGTVTVGKVSEASVAYSLIYMSKSVNFKMHERDDRLPEFSLKSKGLGANYLWKEPPVKWKVTCIGYKKGDNLKGFRRYKYLLIKDAVFNKIHDWHKADLLNRMYCNTIDGKKISMPRYYKDKLYTKTERFLIGENFAQEAEKKFRQEVEKCGGDYGEYVRNVKEKLKEAYFLQSQKSKKHGKI